MGSIVEKVNNKIDGVVITSLKIIEVEGGDVLHAMKKNDPGYNGFGEAYFSIIKLGAIKAWKRHNQMILNLVVCLGEVRFVIYDDRLSSKEKPVFSEITLSREKFYRLTIPPQVWLGFQGIDDMNMILNIADIKHNALEVDRKKQSEINYEWD